MSLTFINEKYKYISFLINFNAFFSKYGTQSNIHFNLNLGIWTRVHITFRSVKRISYMGTLKNKHVISKISFN